MFRRDFFAILAFSLLLFAVYVQASEPPIAVPDPPAGPAISIAPVELAPPPQVHRLGGEAGAALASHSLTQIQGLGENLSKAALCKPESAQTTRLLAAQGQLVLAQERLKNHLQCPDLSPQHEQRLRLLLASTLNPKEAPQALLDALAPLSDLDIDDNLAYLRAEAQLALGQHEDAHRLFSSITDDRYAPHYHEARVGAAMALFQAEKFKEAINALDEVIDDYREYPLRERLFLTRAMAYQQLERFDKAVLDFETVVFYWPYKDAASEAQAALESLADQGIKMRHRSVDERYDRARELRLMKHWDLADRAFRTLLDEIKTQSGHSERENEIWLQLALNDYGRSHYEDALVSLRLLAKAHEEGQGRGTSESYVYKLIARCHENSGRFEEALEAVKKRDAHLSDRSQRELMASFLKDNGRYAEAAKLLDGLLSESKKRTWDYAFVIYKAGRLKEARELLSDLRQHSSGTTRARYTYFLAKTELARGKHERAIELFKQLAEVRAGEYYGIQAINRLLELGINPHHTQLTPSSLAVAQQDSKQAAPPIVLAATSSASASSAPAAQTHAPTQPHSAPGQFYWDGPPFITPHQGPKTQFAVANEGHTPWLSAYSVGPNYHHKLEAFANRWGELFPRARRASKLFAGGFYHQARLEMRNVALEFRLLDDKSRAPKATSPYHFSLKLDTPLTDRRTQKQGFWGLKNTPRLFPVPANKEAKAKLAERQGAIIKQKDSIQEDLILALKEVGDYQMVRRFGLATYSKRSDLLDPEERPKWQMVYPRAFPRLVQENAKMRDLSPYYIWALMKVESSFNPDSISYADARGLLQVIPKTGIKCAVTLGVDEYGPHDLLNEEISIFFGAWYFSALLHKFHGQPLLAFAGYNGGPHNVARWLTKRGHALSMDEFVETIPFTQSRNYAKKVYRFTALYLRLYERQHHLYIGNELNTDFLVDPNY